MNRFELSNLCLHLTDNNVVFHSWTETVLTNKTNKWNVPLAYKTFLISLHLRRAIPKTTEFHPHTHTPRKIRVGNVIIKIITLQSLSYSRQKLRWRLGLTGLVLKLFPASQRLLANNMNSMEWFCINRASNVHLVFLRWFRCSLRKKITFLERFSMRADEYSSLVF